MFDSGNSDVYISHTEESVKWHALHYFMLSKYIHYIYYLIIIRINFNFPS